jgi:signal peptidase I
VLLAVGLLLFLGGGVVLAVKYRVYQVTSASMQPTVKTAERVVVDTAVDGVRRGDVVLLDPRAFPAGDGEYLVKRVIAVGGDTLVCCDQAGRLTLDGRQLGEEYLAGDAPSRDPFSVTVPAGHVFVLGDHRSVSLDSRAHLGEPGSGSVREDSVRGRVVAVAFPLDRLGELPATPAFAAFDPVRGAATGLTTAVCALFGGVGFMVVAAVDWPRSRRRLPR